MHKLNFQECSKNGKTYKEGEEFQIGHLRYKCQKYGCLTGKNKTMKIGESVTIDNVKSQCLAKGSSVYYRETTIKGTLCDRPMAIRPMHSSNR
ncbi:hypothetical protein COOONC_06857 [Cooperia oncophora]